MADQSNKITDPKDFIVIGNVNLLKEVTIQPVKSSLFWNSRGIANQDKLG